ncbi:MAG: polysaccharide biosynthesis tyrosine autokinase [Flavobacteriales bacterium]|nr:polysaccharide biosynthesis tyrosine autokinase [Flavobacteriales bacterium]
MEARQDHETFYYVKFALSKVKKYWYYFLISCMSFVGMAYFVNWYLQPVYEVGSLILIEGGRQSDPSEKFMESFSIFTPSSDISKEIRKMKSLELIQKALERTHAEVSYRAISNTIKKKVIYDDSPFKVEVLYDHPQPLGVKFEVKPKSTDRFTLLVPPFDEAVTYFNYQENKAVNSGTFSVNKEFSYGDTIRTKEYAFVVTRPPDISHDFQPETRYVFEFNDINRLTYRYQKDLKVEQVGKDIQAVSIKLKVKRPQQGIDFINELTKAYMQRNMEKKAALAENSLRYIDREIAAIEGTLNEKESDLQKFRSSHQMMEMKTVSDQAFKTITDLELEKATLESQAKYYDYITRSLQDNQNEANLALPSTMGVNDQVLTGIIQEYLKLSIERSNLVESNKTLNPYYKTIENKIGVQRKALLDYISYMKRTNDLLLSSVDSRLKQGSAKITQLPGTERQLVSIEREKSLNDEVYKYMLRKKADAQIARGSNFPDNDILEDAKLTQMDPVSPNKALNYLLALTLGFGFPFAIFGIKSFLNNTVNDEQILRSVTHLPVIGRVYHKTGQKDLGILDDSPKSPVAESIRGIRTNIEYFLEGKDNQVVLFTSSMSGEGKSFCTLNLANSMAMVKRKTVLVDFDLRRPNQYRPFASENSPGLSGYLSGQAELDDVFVETDIPYLSYIPAGEAPPNPAELIDSERTEYLMEQLKQDYDYVIIDTAPAGLVSESFLLMKHSDLKIIVTRRKVTKISGLVELLNELKVKEVGDLYCLYNDVEVSGTVYGTTNKYFTKN